MLVKQKNKGVFVLYLQRFFPDLLSKDGEVEFPPETFSLQTVQRVAFATLPFFSLYKPFSFPLALGMGGIRVWQSFDNLLGAFQKQDAADKDKLHALIDASISIISLAGTIFAHPLGMCITTAYELIVEITICKELLAKEDLAGASESFMKILNHSLYLACIGFGGLELSIASISVQLLLSVYSARTEFLKGHYIEATSHLLMSLVKGNQLRGQIHTLQTKWKIEAIQKQLNSQSKTTRNKTISSKQAKESTKSFESKSLPLEEKERIRLELEKLGFDVYKITNGGDNVLLQAVRKNNMEAILLAIQYGFDPSFQNKSGDTALHIAAAKGNLSVVQILVQQGASIYIKNKLDQLPFHKGYNCPEIKDYFISIGQERTGFVNEYAIANDLRPDFVDNQGNTFWHNLIKSNNQSFLELALAEGYKLEQLDIANKKGARPFDLIIVQKNKPMLDLFLDRFGDRYVSYDNLHQAAHLGWKPGLEKLLPFFDKQVLLNLSEGGVLAWFCKKEVTKDGVYFYIMHKPASNRPEKNLLHEAIYSGDLDTVKFLVEYGFSPNLSTYSDYQEPTHLFSNILSSHDLDVLAELDHFNQYFNQDDSGEIIKPGGYINPVLSPLSIAQYFHPNNQSLLDYLKGLQAEELYRPSITGLTPDQFFEGNHRFNSFSSLMNTSQKSSFYYMPLRVPGKYLILTSGEWVYCG